jgi:hypothetical protein
MKEARHIFQFIVTAMLGRAIAQAVSRRLPTAAARVHKNY